MGVFVTDFKSENSLCASFHADPSGALVKYDAKAIGSGSEGAQTELQEHYHKVNDAPVIF